MAWGLSAQFLDISGVITNLAGKKVAISGSVAAESLFDVTDSSVHTGTTTNAVFCLEAPNLLAGTLAYLYGASATTTPALVDIATPALTTGSALRVQGNTAAFIAGGKLIEVDMVAAVVGQGLSIKTTGVYTGTGIQRIEAGAMTTGTMLNLSSTTGLAAGGKIINIDIGASVAGQGVNVVTTGAYAGTGLILVTATAITTNGVGIGVALGTAVAGQAISITQSGANYAGTGLLKVLGTLTTTGVGVLVDMAASIAACGLKIVTSGAYASGTGMLLISAPSITTNGIAELIDLGSATAGECLKVVTTGAYTGIGMIEINIGAMTSGVGLQITSTTGLTSGSLIRATTSTASALATNGAYSFRGTGAHTGTTVGLFDVLSSATTAGLVGRFSGTALVGGTVLKLEAVAATLTTGRYLQCYDGALEVLGIGANGHIHTSQTTAPTIAVTTQNGITAAAITAGATDVCGIITTTGSNNNVGDTVLQVTFNKTYTAAPKTIHLMPRNASAAKQQVYISATSATTFDITIIQNALALATPSWSFQVIA